MKPAPAEASKPHMLYLNRAIIPDPENPEKHDAYGVHAPEFVIYTSAGNMVDFAFRGTACRLPWGMLPAFLVSVGFRPLGRLETRSGVKPRPEDFDLTGAVNDLGPRLRSLREQTGLRIGEFARAVRGSVTQLSSIELGEWQENRPPMDQPPAEHGAREFAHRLAGIAIGTILTTFRQAGFLATAQMSQAWLGDDQTRDVVAYALAPHVGSDDRESANAILAATLTDALLRAGDIEPGNGQAV